MKKVCIALMCLCSFLIYAQDTGVSENMSVRLVELDVKVTDFNRNPIPGLSAEDFVVKENDTVQKIESVEEVRLDQLPASEADAYRSRVMLLLDFRNLSYFANNAVLNELEEYINTHFNGITEFGISVKDQRITEIQSFTHNKEELLDGLKRAEVFFRAKRKNLEETPVAGLEIAPNPGQINSLRNGFLNGGDHERRELELLTHFVNYIGAYSGKKNVVLISGSWYGNLFQDRDGLANTPSKMTIKDIISSAIHNKVSFNILNVGRGNENGGPRSTSSARQLDLAASTSGFNQGANLEGISTSLDMLLDKVEHYYRIRYYTVPGNDDFRRVRVRAKGVWKFAHFTSGYFPMTKEFPATTAASQFAADTQGMQVSAKTDWMEWVQVEKGRRQASFVVSNKIYGDNGRLLSEQVIPGQVSAFKENGRYDYPRLEADIKTNLPEGVQAVRVETEIIDLVTGIRVKAGNDTPDWEI